MAMMDLPRHSTPDFSSNGNSQLRGLQMDQLSEDSEDDDEDFPLIPCCTALFLLLISAGLIGTGSIRAYYLKDNSAGVPFWVLGGLLLLPFFCYMYRTFKALRGKNILDQQRLRGKDLSRSSSIVAV